MIIETVKEKTVFFTGHRVIESSKLCELRRRLIFTIMSLADKGYDTFICGGAVGFDTEAAECVMKVRKIRPRIRLLLFLPCRDQTARWKSVVSLERYKKILGAADDVCYITDFYDDDCMLRRNRFMADASSVCVAYMNKPYGGTGYTVRYAEKGKAQIINLFEE